QLLTQLAVRLDGEPRFFEPDALRAEAPELFGGGLMEALVLRDLDDLDPVGWPPRRPWRAARHRAREHPSASGGSRSGCRSGRRRCARTGAPGEGRCA